MTKKYHVISHTHWDREWYLTFQEFRMRLVRLVDKLLAILEEYPDYQHFMLDGQTIILEDYLEIRPEREDILKQHIQEGRILIGPWHILPDMFLVSPEAHIRNLLQGDRTAQKFGPKMPVGYIPDPFGHPGQTPQILRGFGLESAALWRGLSEQPPELRWESPDGSAVFLAYLRDGYGNGANLPVRNPELFSEQIAKAGQSLLAHSAIDECLIMLGTDHMEPPTKTSAVLTYADEHLPDVQVLHSNLPDYVSSARKKLADRNEPLSVVEGELRACDRSHLLPGVLSTRMWIKQRNQHSQTLLEKWAEPFAVFAESLSDYEIHDFKSARATASRWIQNLPPLLRQAWRYLMQNHPHDSICGCSIDQVHEEMKARFDQADQISEEIIFQAEQRLSRAIDTRKADTFSSIVIFNPNGTPHSDLVEVAVDLPEVIASFELIDADGCVIPYEFSGSSHEELANLLVDRRGLRDTIGGANDGWVSGMAIRQVKISRKGEIVKIEAVLDSEGEPNLKQWQEAEKLLTQYEDDPEVEKFQIHAHTPRTSKIRFVSPVIPGMGWQTLWVRPLTEKDSRAPKEVHPLLKPLLPLAMKAAQSSLGEKLLGRLGKRKRSKPPYSIENEFYLVEANSKDGTLTLRDKGTGSVFTGLNQFIDGGDAGDTYNYSPPEKDILVNPSVKFIEVFPDGVTPTLVIHSIMKVPTALAAKRKTRSKKSIEMGIESRISLLPGVRRVDIRTKVENPAKDHRLRVHFPAPFAVSEAHHDGHFEVVNRIVGVPEMGKNWMEAPRPEVPQQAFTDISNGQVGLMVANRGLPEVEVYQDPEKTTSGIALTLMRCVGWLSRGDLPVRQGHAGPALETPGAQMPGTWTFEYAILPHSGDWRKACQDGYAYQTRLRAIETGLHAGGLPDRGSFLSVSPQEFLITAVKPAERGGGWLVRGVNLTEEPLQVEIKPLAKFYSASRVNLAEKVESDLVRQPDGGVQLAVAGHQIASVFFKDEQD